MSDLQELVDDLSAALGRPVGVDDRRFRSLAYSSHVDGVDPVRLASILQRQAPPEVRDWLESLGIAAADSYTRVPANPELGMSARVCVPVRFDSTLLGYLWLIDEPEPLSDAELDESLRVAADMGAALYRTTRLESEGSGRGEDRLRQLLGMAPGDTAAAAEDLLSHSFLALDATYAVLAVAPNHSAGEAAPDSIRVRLAAAMDQLRRSMAPRRLRMLVDGEWVVAIAALDGDGELPARGTTLTTAVGESLGASPEWSATIGVGAPRTRLADVGGSFAEARRAIALGRAVHDLGPLVLWSSLGAYRTLSLLADPNAEGAPTRAEALPPLPESVARLLASHDAATLVPTLERYLEHAGEARAAAADLYIHKSSLYQRLKRIEEIAAVDLSSGDDRLELHLGLRLWRMSGAREP